MGKARQKKAFVSKIACQEGLSDVQGKQDKKGGKKDEWKISDVESRKNELFDEYYKVCLSCSELWR